VPEGLVNDRWLQLPNSLRNPEGYKKIEDGTIKLSRHAGDDDPADLAYYDYKTTEYSAKWNENETWFEMCRGMDKSFAYNKFSRPEDYITTGEVRGLIEELRPKKGRLLLNVGPDENGAIPEYQKAILRELAEK